jgi:hypothetical protein
MPSFLSGGGGGTFVPKQACGEEQTMVNFTTCRPAGEAETADPLIRTSPFGCTFTVGAGIGAPPPFSEPPA